MIFTCTRLGCGTTYNRKPSKAGLYCSRECKTLAARVVRICVACDRQLEKAQTKFCSLDCQMNTRFPHRMEKRFCKQCDKPLPPQYRIYCSNACRSAAVRRYCMVCNAPIKKGNYLFCGRKCRSAAHRSGMYVSAPHKTLWNEAQLAILSKEYPTGTPFDELQRLVNAAGEHQLRARFQLWNWAMQSGVRRVKREPRPVVIKLKRAGYAVPKPVATPRSHQPKPHPIPLREVYRWGQDLGVPLDKRGNVAIVSRAMKEANPGHPGFTVVVPGGWGRVS